MSPVHDPISTFRIGDIEQAGVAVTATQQLGAQFADHRGRIDLPALGVLFDHLGGLPFHLVGQDPQAGSVQARLAMSGLGHIPVSDLLTARAEVLMHDDRWGTTFVEIRTGTGRVCSVGTARNVAVARNYTAAPASADAGDTRPAWSDDHGVVLPPAIDPALSGRDIVAQIAAGLRAPGPLTEMLNGRLELDAESPRLRFIASTEGWMANHFGTMHGGVIATIVAQAVSFAGQAHARAGQDYSLGDLAVGFYRSPAVHGGEVTVEIDPVKVGRRIAGFEATMRAADGMLLSRGSADIHFH